MQIIINIVSIDLYIGSEVMKAMRESAATGDRHSIDSFITCQVFKQIHSIIAINYCKNV